SLRRVVIMEAALPLLGAAVVAAVVGAAVARPLIEALATPSVHVPYPGPLYFLTMGAGLVACFAVVSATLPLLSRITRPETVRFESRAAFFPHQPVEAPVGQAFPTRLARRAVRHFVRLIRDPPQLGSAHRTRGPGLPVHGEVVADLGREPVHAAPLC